VPAERIAQAMRVSQDPRQVGGRRCSGDVLISELVMRVAGLAPLGGQA